MKNLFVIFLLLAAGISTYAQTETEERKVYTFVDQLPEFPGGDIELVNFLQKNIKYPPKVREENIQGRVILRFIINEDGSVSDVTVVRSVDPLLDAEAVRVVSILPKFIPGKQNGVPVPVYFNVPVIFKL